mgnify:CR=1 FL=1
MLSKTNKEYMKIAISLAKDRIGLTGENPSVGCVIVKNNKIISTGQTGINGVPHAEQNAIDNARESLNNSNLFVSLVSDAGTPGISDPGYLIVKNCIDNEIEVECLPGPTALIPALVISGIPGERFSFEGFLPIKKGRKKRLEDLSEEKRTMVFYESPHRITRILDEFVAIFGETRNASSSREISKVFQETTRGSLKDLVLEFTKNKAKGEVKIKVEVKLSG